MKTTNINTYFLRNEASKDHRFCSLRLLLFTAVIALLCSCGKTRHAPLNVSEMFFGKRLSSVSADPRCANRFFVASEDGDVFVLTSSNTTTIDTLFTPFDWIYKVVPCSEAHATYFFIGTRNLGLVLCRRQADSLNCKQMVEIAWHLFCKQYTTSLAENEARVYNPPGIRA